MRRSIWTSSRAFSAVLFLFVAGVLAASLSLNAGRRGPSETQLRTAVERMRPCLVDGERAGSDWLRVSRRSLEARGLLTGNVEEWAGQGSRRLLVGLEIPQAVGALTVYHVIPLVVDERTEILYQGRRVNLPDIPDEPGTYWARATFSPEGRKFHADSIQHTGRAEFGAWPDDVPVPMLGEKQFRQDLARSAEPARPWLDVSQGGGKSSLVGYESGMRAFTPAVRGIEASIEVLVPDRLGPGVVYHLVSIFSRDASRLTFPQPHVLESDAPPPPLKSYEVSLEKGRLMLR